MGTVFPSKRDAWLVVTLWLGAVAMLVGAVAVLVAPGAGAIGAAVAAFFVANAGFMLWVLYGTRYEFGTAELVARCGPFRWRIPLGGIRSVTPSNNPLSSPATSLDRLSVRYASARGRSRRILLSPEDKPGFLEALAMRCPQLERAGDRLVPRG